MIASFALPACGPLAFVALVPLLRGLGGSCSPLAAALGGYALGGVLFGLGGAWIPFSKISSGALPGFALAVGLLAAGPALWAWTILRLGRRAPLAAALAAPGVWVAFELLRASGELGYPWLQLGHALAEQPWLVQLAALGGVPLLSLWIVGVNALTAGTLDRPLRCAALAGAAVALPAALGWAVAGAQPLALALGGANEPVRVAAIQPVTPAEQRYAPQFFDANLRALLELSDRVAPERPDLVVWPESAFELRLGSAGDLLLAGLGNRYGAPVLTGVRRQQSRPRALFNSAVVSLPGGRVLRVADKMHPVPVYERRPGTAFSRALAAAGLWPGAVTPGAAPGLFDVALADGRALRVGVLICFDSSFPALTRELQQRGARLLVEISNLIETGSWSARQHALSARLRAVETGLPLVRVGNLGASEWIDRRGNLVAALPAGRTSVESHALATAGAGTPYARFGDEPVLVLAFLVPGLALLRSLRLRPSNRNLSYLQETTP